MNCTHRVALSFLALAPFVRGAAGQEPLPSSLPRSLAAQACALQEETPGVLLGSGPDYEAVFDERGLEFTPALGLQAPRTFPLVFRATTVTRGENVVDLPSVAPRREEERVVYDRGSGITERYDVGPHGVELSYRFEHPLPGRGELVVRGRLESELPCSLRGETVEGLRFSGAFGGVSIGTVAGIDARGREVRGSLRYDGESLELVLPAAFMDAAAYPLVLDPLIGTVFPAGTSVDRDLDPDVAFDEDSGLFLVAWSRAFSSGKSQIRAQLVRPTTGIVGPLFLVSAGSSFSLDPSVASLPGSSHFFVVWQEGLSLIGPFDIQGSIVDPSGGVSNILSVAGNPAANEIEPDAAGDPDSGRNALVVWNESGVGIQARRIAIDASGNPVFASVQAAITTNPLDSKPALSKSFDGPANARHVVVWETEGTPVQKVNAALIDGNTISPRFEIPNTFGLDPRAPEVDGDGTNFLVTYQTQEIGSGGSKHNIRAHRIKVDPGSGTLSAVGPPRLVAATNGVDETGPAVAWLGDKYVVAWSRETGVLDRNVAGITLEASTGTPCGLEFLLPGSGQLQTDLAISSLHTGVAHPGDRGLIVFSAFTNLPPFDSDVLAQEVEAIGAGGPVVDLGGGCGQGGTIAVNGPVAVGNLDFGVELSGVPAGTLAAAMTFSAPVAPIDCGPCRIIPPLVSFNAALSGGDASVAIPIPCDTGFAGIVVQVQWITVLTGVDPCPTLAGLGLSATDRFQLTVGF